MAVVTRYTELTGCPVPAQQAPITSVEPAAAILEAWAAAV